MFRLGRRSNNIQTTESPSTKHSSNTDKDLEIDQSLVDRFAKACEGGTPDLNEFLPDDVTASFVATLHELIALEMQARWQVSLSPTDDATMLPPAGTETYVRRFPVLDNPKSIVRLAQDEFTIRWVHGDRPTPEDFRDRFPDLPELFETLETMDPIEPADPPPKKVTPKNWPTIPHFLIEKEIGEGGMGSVFLAQQQSPVRRKVAVKVIRVGMDSSEIVARFEAERQAMAMMDHQNIATIYEAGTTDQRQPYFAMEFVNGVPITSYCAKNKLTITQRLNIFLDVCSAIQHAHQKGILHRDLKPSNVLVGEEDGKPTAKVIDFGLAKTLDNTDQLTDKYINTQVGQILGTLKYMSPEQAAVNENDIDTRADVYALGVILYELLVGQTPLDEETLNQHGILKVLELIRDHEAVRPSVKLVSDPESSKNISAQRRTSTSSLRHLLRGDLDWVVMRALENDRERRYDSASTLADDVRRFLNDEPVVARPPSFAYRAKKFARKNRLLVSFIAGMLLLLSAGIVSTTWQWFRALDAETAAKTQERIAVAKAEESEQRRREADGLRVQEATARKEAEAETQRAQKILHFVVDSFQSADPMRGAKADMLARDVLIQALDNVKEQVSGDPLTQAQLYFEIGASLHGLGDEASAIKAAQLARTYFTEAVGSSHLNTIAANNLLADARLGRGDGYAAWDLYNNSLSMLMQVLPREKARNKQELLGSHPLAVETMIGFARATVDPSSNMQEFAVNAANGAVDAARRFHGEEHSQTLVALSTLAKANLLTGETDEAVSLYEKIQRRRVESLGRTHPETVAALTQLSQVLMQTGKTDEAIKISTECVDSLTTKLGKTHPRTCAAECLLAETLGAGAMWENGQQILTAVSERFSNARPAYRRAARTYAKKHVVENDLQSAIDLYSASPVDHVWIYVVANQPKDAALTLADWDASEPNEEYRSRILKRRIVVLLWDRDFDQVQTLLDERKAEIESRDVAGLQTQARLAQLQIWVAKGEFEKAIADANALLNQRMDPKVAEELRSLMGDMAEKSRGGSILRNVDQAWVASILTLCQAEVAPPDSKVLERANEAFRQLHLRMHQMPDYQRWTVVRAAERLVRIYEITENQLAVQAWRQKLDELEAERVRLTMDDSWFDSLIDHKSGGVWEAIPY